MRAKEFISEVKIDVPNQMVTIQVPLKDIMSGELGDTKDVVNPGKRAGHDGKYKWSPPLQQQLDAEKDAIGDSNEETNEVDAEITAAEDDADDEELNNLRSSVSSILSNNSR